MISLARKGVIALCCAVSVWGVAFSQDGGQATAEGPGAAEEVIVRGRTRATLRIQIERAQEAVYDRFNEINSNDEFDIHCRREAVTGSRYPRRVCRANFWRNEEATAARETVIGLQGGSSFDAQQFAGEALYKSQLLAKEMRRLATEDTQLQQAVLHLQDLQQAMGEHRQPAAWSGPSSAHVVAAGEEDLPYDAARKADVRMGREPWSYVLTRQTFTIANVYGDIRALEVDCGARTEQLQYKAGEEWTVPGDWGSCTVLVRATPSTTFSLYEFE